MEGHLTHRLGLERLGSGLDLDISMASTNVIPTGSSIIRARYGLFDGQLSYDFTFVPPVENQPVAGYSKDAKDMTQGKDGKATEPAVAQTATSLCRCGNRS